MEQLLQLVSSDVPFVHIIDYFSQGEKDENWIPKLSAEGGWVVITADGGKQSKRGQKLPDLCWEYGITHVVLSSTLHSRKSHEKVGILTTFWNEIELLHEALAGSHYRLRFKPLKGKTAVTVALELVRTPSIPDLQAQPDQSEP